MRELQPILNRQRWTTVEVALHWPLPTKRAREPFERLKRPSELAQVEGNLGNPACTQGAGRRLKSTSVLPWRFLMHPE